MKKILLTDFAKAKIGQKYMNNFTVKISIFQFLGIKTFHSLKKKIVVTKNLLTI